MERRRAKSISAFLTYFENLYIQMRGKWDKISRLYLYTRKSGFVNYLDSLGLVGIKIK